MDGSTLQSRTDWTFSCLESGIDSKYAWNGYRGGMEEWGLKETGWMGVSCAMRGRGDWRRRRLRIDDHDLLGPVNFQMPIRCLKESVT